MKENNKNQPTTQLDKEPGKPGYKPGNTAVPQQEVQDEDVKAEQEQVVNNDDAATETKQPAKMSTK